ncbi:low affinity iron permease family protein [Paraburkholderia sp.]|uniref:low affinity iron permease family protein n=1 Tax=Paraburkholderia sp. TaxID=1926495 RepID=UPI0039E61DF6
MNDLFHQFAKRASDASGSPWAFAISVFVLFVWAVTGPFFHFSDTWQLTINTASSIIPTIMVFLIQNTQNRDARALHLKIDELLRLAEGGKSPFINLQTLSDDEINQLANWLSAIIRSNSNSQDTSDSH